MLMLRQGGNEWLNQSASRKCEIPQFREVIKDLCKQEPGSC